MGTKELGVYSHDHKGEGVGRSLMDDMYYLIKNNQIIGPLDGQSILRKVESKELHWLDRAFPANATQPISDLKNLKPLLCISRFSKKLTMSLKASASTSVSEAEFFGKFLDREWYLFRSNMPIGPFSKLEIIQMLQEKTLESDSYVWCVGSEGWNKVSEWAEFSKKEIQSLSQSKNTEVHRVFYKRKYLRAQFDCSLIVNDEKTMFHGDALEISEGGVGIKLKNSNFNIGHRIFLHFKSGEGVPAFNAVGEIVSRQFPKNENEVEVRYGVKFLNVSNYVKDSIRTYTTLQASS